MTLQHIQIFWLTTGKHIVIFTWWWYR